jgi:hypothetical protein
MSEETWTWILAALEVLAVTGMWVAGHGHRYWWGWGLVLLSSFAWFVYAVTFSKHGFIVMSLLWGTTHTRNMLKWRSQKKAEDDGRQRRSTETETDAV